MPGAADEISSKIDLVYRFIVIFNLLLNIGKQLDNRTNMNYTLKEPISQMAFKTRQGLFARLSEMAYFDKKTAVAYGKSIGFTQVKFFDIGGAQAYLCSNKNDTVIACRGTEPTEWNDIKADLNAFMVKSDTVGKVHLGFKNEVDDIWKELKESIYKIGAKKTHKEDIWFTGHSLGGAMATIVASRCYEDSKCPNPQELYTYGSPRVGNRTFVKTLAVKHHRHVNNNDIVTRVPLWLMGYRHDGELHYFNCNGVEVKLTGWGKAKDKFIGLWRGLKQLKIDSFSDHSIGQYAEQCER